ASIVKDHQRFLKEKYIDSEAANTEASKSAKQIDSLEQELRSLNRMIPNLNQEFNNELQLTLKNAYIMPATLRDLAGQFLATQQKDFKVGFFQSKKKTLQEKERRLTDFYQAL